ncbi:PadR family transcriptional regulator [Bacillus sp. MKU004]|nr:PadR family transcriptional regulator [Bacillus sp. MKU004]QTC43397.1 Z-ring formation inhibitor MciZ [Bacillus sp. V3]
MQVIVEKDRIILAGKAWEVRAKLKEYSRKYETVKEWTTALVKE